MQTFPNVRPQLNVTRPSNAHREQLQLLVPQGPPSASCRQSTLTRQQTFPPVQPFARMRYMSTTAEMSQCCTQEVLVEADSSSSRSCSPCCPPGGGATSPAGGNLASDKAICTSGNCTIMDSLSPIPSSTLGASPSAGELRRHSTPAQSKNRPAVPGTGRRFTTIPLTQEAELGNGQRVFFIGSPPDSPPRLASATPSSDSGSGSGGGGGGGAGEPRRSIDSVSLPGNKRDYGDAGSGKSSKMLKLMKENVDPRGAEELAKGSHGLGNRRANNQVGVCCFV